MDSSDWFLPLYWTWTAGGDGIHMYECCAYSRTTSIPLTGFFADVVDTDRRW
jgi:hypothetical protein